MKIKTRSDDDASMMQMNDWLAKLRDEDRTEPTQDDTAPPGAPIAAAPNESAARAETDAPVEVTPAAVEFPAHAATPTEADVPPRAGTPARAAAPAKTGTPARAGVHPYADTPARAGAPPYAGTPARAGAPPYAGTPARAGAPARTGPPADASPAASTSERAVIGDQIRMPIMWCEMGSCISWYTHRGALGEADTRARAIADGWRIDALGRLTCPECQQTDPRFWSSCTVVPWDRYTAIARTARITAVRSEGARGRVPEISHDRGRGTSGDRGRAASGHPAASPVESVWLRSYAAARAM
jgi:hypothetical protein